MTLYPFPQNKTKIKTEQKHEQVLSVQVRTNLQNAL